MMLFEVSLQQSASANLAKLAQGFSRERRGELHNAVGDSVGNLITAHLDMYAGSHHATANRLGATPTRYINKAAQNTSHAADDTGATIVIKSSGDFDARGMHRARRDLEIKPREKQWLTIPLHALAYGRRVKDVKAEGIAIFRPKGKNILATSKDGELIALYALVKSARVPRDPDLLPDDDAIKATAGLGIKNFIKRRLGQ